MVHKYLYGGCMAVKADHRINKTSEYIIALVLAFSLALIFWLQGNEDSAKTILKSVGYASAAITTANIITKKWLWKSWIGKILDYPPDYSGDWEGTVFRNVADSSVPKENRVDVVITQTITNIEWSQCGYSDDGVKISESRFILGEVVDEQRKWDAIIGVYEVARPGGSKDKGLSVVQIEKSGTEMTGLYCGLNGHVGSIKLKRK